MEPNKAIELSKETVASLRQGKFTDHADAVQLGIEALTAIISGRHHKMPGFTHPLPGEDTTEVTIVSKEDIKKVKASPLGREPKG